MKFVLARPTHHILPRVYVMQRHIGGMLKNLDESQLQRNEKCKIHFYMREIVLLKGADDGTQLYLSKACTCGSINIRKGHRKLATLKKKKNLPRSIKRFLNATGLPFCSLHYQQNNDKCVGTLRTTKEMHCG
ncbi:unnamed protein product [Ixodes persulcatus]